MTSVSHRIVSEHKEHLQLIMDELIQQLDPENLAGCRIAINDLLPNSRMDKIADSERLSKYEDFSSEFRWVQDFSLEGDKVKGLAGLVASIQRPIISGNVKEHPYWIEFDKTANSAKATSIICIPILNKSEKTRCVGVLSVTSLIENFFEETRKQNLVFKVAVEIGNLWDVLLTIDDPENPPRYIWLSLKEAAAPESKYIQDGFRLVARAEDEQFQEKGGRKPVRTNRLWKLFYEHEQDIFTLDFIADKLFFHSKTPRRSAANAISELNKAFEEMNIDLECVRLTAYVLRQKSDTET